jgi:hypothetical protein
MMTSVDDLTGTGRGWATPGSAAEQPAPGAAGGPGLAPGGALPWPAPGPGGDVAEPVPRVALRPMTVADILDGGFGVVKARPRRIIGVTAGFVIPIQLLVALTQRSVFGGAGISDLLTSDPAVTNSNNEPDFTPFFGSIAAVVLSALALTCVAAAIAHLVGQWTMGRDAPAGEMLTTVGRRFGALLVAFLLVKVAEAIGAALCYIGLLFVFPLFVVVTPAVVIEGIGPFQALDRSVRLVRRRYWTVMGVALLMGIVGQLLSTALSLLPQALTALVGFENGWPILALGGIAANLVVMPFIAAATVLLYLDLRVRSEGLDIEMAAIDLFDRAA